MILGQVSFIVLPLLCLAFLLGYDQRWYPMNAVLGATLLLFNFGMSDFLCWNSGSYFKGTFQQHLEYNIHK